MAKQFKGKKPAKKPVSRPKAKPKIDIKINSTKPKRKARAGQLITYSKPQRAVNRQGKAEPFKKKRKTGKSKGIMAVFVGSNPVASLGMTVGLTLVGFVMMRLLSDAMFWMMSKMDARSRRIAIMVLQPVLLLIGYFATRSGKYAGPARAVWTGAATYTGLSIGGSAVSMIAPSNCVDNAACVTAKAIFPDYLSNSFEGQLMSHRAGYLIESGRMDEAGYLIESGAGNVDVKALTEQAAKAIMDAQQKALSSPAAYGSLMRDSSGALILDRSLGCYRTNAGFLVDTSGYIIDSVGQLIGSTTPAFPEVQDEDVTLLDFFGQIGLQPSSVSGMMGNSMLSGGMLTSRM